VTDLAPVAPEAPGQVTTLRAVIGALDAERAYLTAGAQWQRLTAGLVQIDALLRDLRELRRACEQDIANLMMQIPSSREFVEGVGTVEVKTDIRRRNWQSRDLAMAAVANAVEAGDIGHPIDVVALMLDLFSISAAKVTTVRARGFDPDEWCETEWGHQTIRITS
jgi:hypothetical protein